MNTINFTPDVQGASPIPSEPKIDFTPDKVDSNQAATSLGQSNSLLGNIISGAKNIATGVAKSELGTITGLGTLAAEAGSMIPGKMGEFFAGGAQLGKETMASPVIQPQGTGEQVGKTATDIAQFLAPVGAVGKIEKGIGALSKVGGLIKTGLKAGVEAFTGGGVSLAQTADPKQALTTALTFGALKGTTGAIGMGLKAMGIPEHLYSTIFKTSARDMLDELKTGGLATLQKENPSVFKQFVDEGIIKSGADGAITLNESLAKQALDRGLRGSVSNMANVLVKGTLKNESKAQIIAKTTTAPVVVPSADKLIKVLQTVATDYENVGQGEIAQKAQGFVDTLGKSGGQVDAPTALSLRRFLDSMRAQSSYNPQVKLSTTGQNFKYWSNVVRGQVNKIPGMAPLMKDYTFNIEALTSLAKTAATRGNQAVVNMLDVLIFEGGLQGGTPGIGAGMSIFRKAITTPWGATKTGSAIEKAGTMSKTGALIKGTLGEGVNTILGGQGQQ